MSTGAFGLPRRGLWALPPLAVLSAAFFYPLLLVGWQSLHAQADAGPWSTQNFSRLLGSTLFRNALTHTLEISLAATAGCLLLGFVLALVFAFVPFPGAKILARLIDTYIALPTFLLTLAFTFIYGSAGLLNGVALRHLGFSEGPVHFLYTIWGVILAEVTAFTPFVLRPLLAAFSQLDVAMLEVAASLGASPWRMVRSIVWPAALPALLAGGSMCLLLTVNEFGIVLFIGAKGVVTLPLLVYDKAIQEGDYVMACTIAVLNIAISLALYGLYSGMVDRLGRPDADLVR